MSLKNDVARIERAGSENAIWFEKLRQSIDNLAHFLGRFAVDGGLALPWGYTLKYYPSREYQFEKKDHHEVLSFILRNHESNRSAVFAFADDIASGWLNEVSIYLEGRNKRLQRTDRHINQFLTEV